MKSFKLKSTAFIKSRFKILFFAALVQYAMGDITDYVDGVFAGNFFGESGIAVIGIVMPIYSIIYFFGGLVSIGAGVRFAAKIGKFDKDNAEKILGEALVVTLLISVVLSICLMLVRDTLISSFNVSQQVADLTKSYYDGIVLVAFLYPIYWLISVCVFNDGDSGRCVLAEISRFIFNIVLSIGFVKIFNLGMFGLSLGTAVSIFICILVNLTHLIKKSNNIGFKLFFKFSSLKQSVMIGASTSLICLLSAIVEIILNSFFSSRFGDEGLTMYTMTASAVLFFQLWVGVASAMVAIFSTYYGEKNFYQCKNVCLIAIKYSFIAGLICSAIYFAIAPYVPIFYGMETPKLIEMTILSVRVIGFTSFAYILVLVFIELYAISDKTGLSIFLSVIQNTAPVLVALLTANFVGLYSALLGYASASIIALILGGIFILIVKKPVGFPFYLPKTEHKISNYCLHLSNESITYLNNEVNKEINKYSFTASSKNIVILISEELLSYILSINKKKVLVECNLMIKDKEIQIVFRDNGKLFDITNEEISLHSLNAYLLGRISDIQRPRYLTTTNYNRNSFLIKDNWSMKHTK